MFEIAVHVSGIITTSGDEIDVTDVLHLHSFDEREDELGHPPCIDRKDETKFFIGSQFVGSLSPHFIGYET